VPTNPTTLRPMPLPEESGRLREALGSRIPSGQEGRTADGKSFLDTLEESIQQVNNLQEQANQAIDDLATGESKDVAQTMLAVQKASLSFQMMTQVRNKIVQAYEDVMRMPM